MVEIFYEECIMCENPKMGHILSLYVVQPCVVSEGNVGGFFVLFFYFTVPDSQDPYSPTLWF